ncbi:hypothetical protein ABBQ32_008689 [Trebouxia sp. C0010 RCD-2024]
MGFFRSKSIEKKLPKRKVEDWKKADISKWLALLQLTQYEDSFKSMSGKRLLQLSAADIYRFADNKPDADTLLESIRSLRETGTVATKLMAEDSANNFSQNSGSEDNSPLPSESSTPTGAEAQAVEGPFYTGEVCEAPQPQADVSHQLTNQAQQLVEEQPESHQSTLPVPQPPRGPEENAKILSSWTGGTQAVAQLFSYLNQLHIVGGGLVDATECCPVIGHIVGAIWELHDLAAKARGHKANCLLLDSFLQDIMRTLDNQGRVMADADGLQLAHLLELIEAAIELVDSCNKPGWLLRMAGPNKFFDELTRIHSSMLDLCRAMKVDTLRSGRQLTYGAYKDCSRPLRRCLKQMGNGSMDGGLRAITSGSKALEEVAAMLDVEKQAVLREAESAGLTLDADARSSTSDLTSPTSPTVNSLNRDHQAIFQAYDRNRSGALELEELHAVLADLGIMDGVKQTEVDSYVAQQFRQADTDGDGQVTFEDFSEYYQAMSISRARLELRSTMGMEAERSLRKVFVSFASFAVRVPVEDLDGAKFSKLCRDAKLLGKRFGAIDVDIVFAKVKVKGQRRIAFDQFVNALGIIAEKKGQALRDVVQAVLDAGGPSVIGTRAGYVKFHDDKSLYTGVYARGGPTNIEPSNELSALLDRSPADVRGVKFSGSPGVHSPLSGSMTARGSPSSGGMTSRGHIQGLRTEPAGFGYGNSSPSGSMTARRTGTSFANSSPSGSMTARGSPSFGSMTGRATTSLSGSVTTRTPPPRSPSSQGASAASTPSASRLSSVEPEQGRMSMSGDLKPQLVSVFKAFAAFGSGSGTYSSPAKVAMDGASFAKLCRDSGLLGGKLNTTSVDIAFSKAKAKGARRMSFKEFENALELLAAGKGVSGQELRQQVAASAGPLCNATQAAAVRLHDDKSTYTGQFVIACTQLRKQASEETPLQVMLTT